MAELDLVELYTCFPAAVQMHAEAIEDLTFSRAGDLRKRLADVANAGVTEMVYQPAGPDVERELRAFAGMAGLGHS